MQIDIDFKVAMEIVPQIATKPKNGRRGQKPINAGTLLYCIHYVGYDGFFTFSYLNRKDAESCIRMMKNQGTDTVRYMQFNYALDVDKTMHVWDRD